MLSYRHGFHAGSAADVLKHLVLIFCLDYLVQKEKPLLCVDTHAGAGLYGPADTLDTASRERQRGIGRLRSFVSGPEAPPAPAVRYLELTGGETYPGSPFIMAKLLRERDRLVCFELHPRDFETLLNNAAAFKKSGGKGPAIEVRKEDGPLSLKALLPPLSRRGLVLIDPSWEEKDEYNSVPRFLGEGLRRFAEGTFVVWYPLLANQKIPFEDTVCPGRLDRADPLGERLYSEIRGKRCRLELFTGRAESGPESPRGMYGSGLVISNPPWTLRPALEVTLPYLAKALAGPAGAWRFDWE